MFIERLVSGIFSHTQSGLPGSTETLVLWGRGTDRRVLLLRYSAEEIEEKVSSFRMMLQEKQDPSPSAEKPT